MAHLRKDRVQFALGAGMQPQDRQGVMKEDRQGRAGLDSAIVVTTGRKMPSPARIPKSAEVNKNGEGKTEARKRSDSVLTVSTSHGG